VNDNQGEKIMHCTEITTPTTLRFTLGGTNEPGPRMRLEDLHFGEGEWGKNPRNCLFIATDHDQVKAFWNTRGGVGKAARLGSRRRYRQEAEIAREIVAHLGWTLTPDEESLLQAIEAYGREHAAERAAA
jgi:hypothetical protein